MFKKNGLCAVYILVHSPCLLVAVMHQKGYLPTAIKEGEEEEGAAPPSQQQQ